MTNNEIIFWESYELMKHGKIKGTGRIIEMETENGRVQVEEPEALHTFAAWKQLGYVVKKGQHATAQITIWKHTSKQLPTDTGNPETDKMNKAINDQGGQESMFRKVSSFFTFAQVQPLNP